MNDILLTSRLRNLVNDINTQGTPPGHREFLLRTGIPMPPIDDSTPNIIHNVDNRSLVERAAALGIQIRTPAESKWAAAQDKAKRLMELRKQMGMLPNEPNKDSFHNNHNANTGSGILVGSGKKKKKTRRKRRKRKTKTKRKRKRRTRKKRKRR